ALEGRRALFDARRPNQSARRRGQVANRKLVDAVRNRRRRHVHVETQIEGSKRAHELARLFDIAQRILASRRTEHDVGWTLAYSVEEAIGGKIANAGSADGRDPTDRSWHAQGLEGVVL